MPYVGPRGFQRSSGGNKGAFEGSMSHRCVSEALRCFRGFLVGFIGVLGDSRESQGRYRRFSGKLEEAKVFENTFLITALKRFTHACNVSEGSQNVPY